MAYVAPNWKNGQAPALDAAALQAISDAIVANQTKNTQQDSSISSLQTAVNGKSRVATGSYTGTGTYGASNPNSITFPFTPKLVWIYGEISRPTETNMRSTGVYAPIANMNYSTRLIIDLGDLSTSYTNEEGFVFGGNQTSNREGAYARKNGNTLSWYHTSNSVAQVNSNTSLYKWIAFG